MVQAIMLRGRVSKSRGKPGSSSKAAMLDGKRHDGEDSPD